MSKNDRVIGTGSSKLDVAIKVAVLSGLISEGENLQLTIQCSIANKGRDEIYNLSGIAGLYPYQQKVTQGIASDGAWVTISQPVPDPLQVMAQAAVALEANVGCTDLGATLLPHQETSGILLARGPTRFGTHRERAGAVHFDLLLVVVARFGTSSKEHQSRIASSFILQRDAKGGGIDEQDSYQQLRLLAVYENRLL